MNNNDVVSVFVFIRAGKSNSPHTAVVIIVIEFWTNISKQSGIFYFKMILSGVKMVNLIKKGYKIFNWKSNLKKYNVKF